MVCSVKNDLGRCPAKFVAVVAARISRDPIEESGGNNLYCIGYNSTINGWDSLGDSWSTPDDHDTYEWAWHCTGGLVYNNLRILLNIAFGDKGKPLSSLENFKYKTTRFNIIFVNGIWNTSDDVKKSANDLQKSINAKYNAKVGYVYNKTGIVNSDNLLNRGIGSIYDLIQVVMQQQTRLIDSTSEFLADKTNDILEKNECKHVYWVAHSQGGAVISAAWLRIHEKVRSRIRVIVAAGANLYGFDNALSYDAFYKDGDPVPWLAGSALSSNAHKIPGFEAFGHSFDPNYIKEIAKQIEQFLDQDSP